MPDLSISLFLSFFLFLFYFLSSLFLFIYPSTFYTHTHAHTLTHTHRGYGLVLTLFYRRLVGKDPSSLSSISTFFSDNSSVGSAREPRRAPRQGELLPLHGAYQLGPYLLLV